MILEKIIRKKRISSFNLEIWGGFIYQEVLLLLLMLVIGLIDGFGYGWVISLLLIICLITIAMVFDMKNIIITAYHLNTDKKVNRKIIQDIAIIDYDYSFATRLIYGGYIYTFTHLFYLEPYIRIVILNFLPLGAQTISIVPPKFHMEEISITCWRQENYKELRAEFKKYEDDIENDRIRYEIPKKTRRDYEDNNHTILYMTYDKMQAFNKLFELVSPPEFRITSYEKSWVFISIEPIPGKEYPPEALECMEKINAMYP